MTNHRTAVTIHRANDKPISVGVGLWRDSWQDYDQAREVMGSVRDLWQLEAGHRERGHDRSSPKPKTDWESRLGLKSQLRHSGEMSKSAQKATAAVNQLMDAIETERRFIKPYKAPTDSPTEAVLVQGVRQQLFSMTPAQRESFLSRPLSDRTRRALFEMDAPELAGMDRESALYTRLRDESLDELHGERIQRLDDLDALVGYALKLADGIDQAAKAEAIATGVSPDELDQALAAATRAAA